MPFGRSIRFTLLDSLFRKPRAISLREFKRAQGHLFPGVEDFLSFLRDDDYQQITDHAKNIITRLVYHHHLPPPTRLLFNLLDFEEQGPQAQQEGDFVPKDHFVHLVHLYLLGIYFFAYHKTLHAECTTELNRLKRARAPHLSESTVISSYEVFGTAWAMFVLYHDLGYPFERILPDQRLELDKWLKPFKRIRKSILKDLALKALSNLTAISAILHDDLNLSLNDMYLGHHDGYFVLDRNKYKLLYMRKRPSGFKSEIEESEEKRLADILKRWESAVFVRGVGGLSTMKILGTFLPDISVGAVLENTITGEPFLFIRKQDEREVVFWLQDPEVLPSSVRQARRSLWNMAFRDGAFPGEIFGWKYFARGTKEYLTKSIESLLGDQRSGFKRIASYLGEKPAFNRAKLTSRDLAPDLAYETYKWLSAMLGYMKDEDETSDLELLIAGYGKGISSAGMAVPAIVASCVQELFRGEVEKGTVVPGDVLRGMKREEALKLFIDVIVDHRSDLEQRLDEAITPKIKENVELEQLAREGARKVRMLLASKLEGKESDASNPFAKVTFDDHFDLSEVGKAIEGMDNLDGALKGIGLYSFSDLARAYKPSWVATDERYNNKTFVDHGLASAVVLFVAAGVYRECLKRLRESHLPDAPADIKLLRLALGSTAAADENWLAAELGYLLGEVALSVSLHNVYPSFLPPPARSYRTNVGKESFAYLALLADGLQRWDRKRLAKQATMDIKGIIPGSQFDLQVEGDMIYISFRARKLDFHDEEKSLRDELRNFLAGANDLIKLKLMEW